jgi:hypothetical protein
LNGLIHHVEEVKTFIINHNIDILLISEAHFSTKNYFRIPNYATYITQQPEGKAQGGTAVIKNSTKHHELNKYERQHLQATRIALEDWQGPLTIAARPVISKAQFEDFYRTLGSRFIAGGHYNVKHPRWLFTPRARQLVMTLETNNLTHLSTGEPKYWPTDIKKVPDLIDFCVIKGIPNHCLNANSCLDLSSDHSPVLISLSTTTVENTKPPSLEKKIVTYFVRR